MVEQQPYITSILSPTDALADEASALSDGTISSVASSYPELASFSTQVSSFTLPAQCDADLLTPISTADSPPLHQIHKFMGQYPPPPGSPHCQEPTPPGSSKMYHQWNNQFEISGGHPSGTSSPMNTPGHVAPDFYLSEDRRTPGPPEPYMGSFGVSDSTQSHPISQGGPPYYLDIGHMPNHNNLMLRDNPPLTLEPQHRDLDRSVPLSAPLLHDAPRGSQSRRGRRLTSEDSGPRADMESVRSPKGSPRRSSILGTNNRVKKSKSGKKQSSKSHQPDPDEEHQNCHGQETPPPLKDSCPEEERRIFESRWRHRNKRGNDMWDAIQSDFLKEFNKSHGKEMLQMKFKRARSKYLQWLPRDNEILLKAWKRLEQERYQRLLDIFIELGGSKNMRLNASDMEVKVVSDMKLEENLYMETPQDLDLRRRKKFSAKKRPSTNGRRIAAGADDESTAVSVDTDDVSSVMAQPPHYTHQQEDEVINQVHGRLPKVEFEDDMMDMHMWDSRTHIKMEHPSAQPRLLNGVSTRAIYSDGLPAGSCI